MFNVHDETTQFALKATGGATANTVLGTGVDMRDYIGKVSIILDVGNAVGGPTSTLDVAIQSSADNLTAWTLIAGGSFTQSTMAGSGNKQTMGIDVDLGARYWRAFCPISGSSPNWTFSVNGIGRKQVV